MIPEGASIPEVTVTQAVFAGRPRGDRPALVDATSGRTMSYAQLAADVRAVAAGLTGAGLGRGSVIALHLPDSPEFAVALHGVLTAGAVATTIRPTTPIESMTRQLRETGARTVITWPVLLDIALEAVKPTEADRIFCFGDEPDVEPFSSLLDEAGEAPGHEIDQARAPALLAYTRGSTGPSHEVRLTHRNLVGGFRPFAEAGILSSTDVVLSGVPFADVMGLSGALHPALYAGATVVTRPAAGRHDLLRTLQDHRVTVALLTPAQVELLAFDQAVRGYNLRSLRSIISTGGPLAPETARACSIRLRCPVRQAYGLAETGGITHVNLRAAQEGTLDSVGPGLPPVRSRIVDPGSGTDQPSYQPGELWLRGPMTAAAPRSAASWCTGEWLCTGDTAFADEHGRVYVLGRLGGAGAEPPTDPQTALAAHAGVADAVVVPIPDPELGLVPHAFVVPHSRRLPSAPMLLAYVNSHVPEYQQIAAVHVVTAIPRSPSGRVMRRALIERSRLPSQEGW